MNSLETKPSSPLFFKYAYGVSREEMASFFDPCIEIVLDGLRKRIESLFLNVNVGLFVRERRY